MSRVSPIGKRNIVEQKGIAEKMTITQVSNPVVLLVWISENGYPNPIAPSTILSTIRSSRFHPTTTNR